MNARSIIRNSIEVLRDELDNSLPKAKIDDVGVLYIDDEEKNLKSLKSLFRKEKFIIYTASNLEEALKILKSNNIHVVITDYKMPKNNGVQCMELIHKKYPEVVGIALTAYATEEIKNKFLEKVDVKNIIEKPFSFNEVKKIIIDSYKIYIFNVSKKWNTDQG